MRQNAQASNTPSQIVPNRQMAPKCWRVRQMAVNRIEMLQPQIDMKWGRYSSRYQKGLLVVRYLFIYSQSLTLDIATYVTTFAEQLDRE